MSLFAVGQPERREVQVARATGMVLRRALTQKLVVLSAFGTILLATTVLATLILYATSVTDDGIKRTLETAAIDDVGTRITSRVDTADDYGPLDTEVRNVTATAYAGAPAEIYTAARSESYGLPGQENEPDALLTVFAAYERIEEHARLATGRWPDASATGDGPVEAVLPTAAAQFAGISSGSTITIRSRLDDIPVDVTITGLFEPLDRDDPYWQVDELALTGTQTLAFTTHGPLVVSRETFDAAFATDAAVAWQVVPDLRDASSEQVRAFTDAPAVYRSGLTANQPGSTTSVRTNLATLAERLERAALVARSTMLIPVLQLVVLAGYALFLTARLLADHRRSEIALLRARGADGGQLAALTLREGALLGMPAAIAAPILATPLLRLVNASPTVRASGITVDDTLRPASWAAAAIAAAACALALAVPSLRGLRQTYVESQQARGRGGQRSASQRAGADLAVLLIAVLGFLQLQRYGGPLTATAEQAQSGGLGIDPFIVAGPAIGLFAGGVLALRLVPVMSRAVERVTSRGSGFAPALGAWQLARRPLRYAGPALLLVLAVAVGVLSLSTSSTWRKSQVDQANFQVGGDLRIVAKSGAADMPPLGHGGRYRELPGVTAISPTAHVEGIVGDNNDVELVAVDADTAADVIRLRSDLVGATGIRELADGLVAARPALASIALPGEPAQLGIDVSLALTTGPADDPFLSRVAVAVQLRDGTGVGHTVAMGEVAADGSRRDLVADLVALAGAEGRVAYPLTVEGFTFSYPGGTGEAHRLITVHDIRVSDAAEGDLATAATVPEDTRWQATVFASTGFAQAGVSAADLQAPSVGPGDGPGDGEVLRAELRTAGEPPGAFGLRFRVPVLLTRTGTDPLFAPIGSRERPPVDAVVTEDVLARTNSAVGDTIPLVGFGSAQPLRVIGVVDSLPGTDPGNGGALVDFRTWSAVQFAATGTHPLVREWWASTGGGGDTDAAADMLVANPALADDVVDCEGLARQLRDDPLGGGLQGALYLGFVAAFAFAAIGFAVNAAVSARERVTEFALMRAMGVSSRQVFGLLGVEQALLVALGVLGGVALGAVVTYFVVPHIVLTAQASQVHPPVLVSIPWLQVLVLVLVVIAILGGIVVVLARSLRRGGLGEALRIGEDR